MGGDISVLGRVRLRREAAVLHLQPREEKALIALVINPNGVEPATLAEAVWPEEKARQRHERALPPLIAELRKKLRDALGDEASIDDARSGVYRLRVPTHAVDYWRFLEALSQARDLLALGMASEALAEYEAAGREWLGTPLGIGRSELERV